MLDMRDRGRLWLCTSAATAAAPAPSACDWLHEVDTALPAPGR